MSTVEDLRKGLQDFVAPELSGIKEGLSSVKEESIQLIRSYMIDMERRLEDKIAAARTEILLKMEVPTLNLLLAEEKLRSAEQARQIEELKKNVSHSRHRLQIKTRAQ